MKKFTKKELEKVVKKSYTIREILLHFERNTSSGSYKSLNKCITLWKIDTSHLLNRSDSVKRLHKLGLLIKKVDEEIFTENSNVGRSTVKNRIIEKKLIEYKCEKCSNSGEWMGKKITLILDHKNGINNDHRLINLRFLCPNCNSTLETHCLGSFGVERKKEKLIKRSIKIKRKYAPRINKRKVQERPSKEELKKMIEKHSYSFLGRKYNVSDNAIRKWAKHYQII